MMEVMDRLGKIMMVWYGYRGFYTEESPQLFDAVPMARLTSRLLNLGIPQDF